MPRSHAGGASARRSPAASGGSCVDLQREREVALTLLGGSMRKLTCASIFFAVLMLMTTEAFSRPQHGQSCTTFNLCEAGLKCMPRPGSSVTARRPGLCCSAGEEVYQSASVQSGPAAGQPIYACRKKCFGADWRDSTGLCRCPNGYRRDGDGNCVKMVDVGPLPPGSCLPLTCAPGQMPAKIRGQACPVCANNCPKQVGYLCEPKPGGPYFEAWCCEPQQICDQNLTNTAPHCFNN
jgi:hypothetical protein